MSLIEVRLRQELRRKKDCLDEQKLLLDWKEVRWKAIGQVRSTSWRLPFEQAINVHK